MNHSLLHRLPASVSALTENAGDSKATMPDDSRFLAASHAALALVNQFGCLPRLRKAESVGKLTFILLEILRAQYQTGD